MCGELTERTHSAQSSHTLRECERSHRDNGGWSVDIENYPDAVSMEMRISHWIWRKGDVVTKCERAWLAWFHGS